MPPLLLSPKAVCARISISRTTLDRLAASGEFPAPVRITPRRLAYSAELVDAWVACKLGREAA